MAREKHNDTPVTVPWHGYPESVTCRCGVRFTVAISSEVKHPSVRSWMLAAAASNAGWYQLGVAAASTQKTADQGQWIDPACFGSLVLEAVMLKRAGQHTKMRVCDQATERRVVLSQMVVPT